MTITLELTPDMEAQLSLVAQMQDKGIPALLMETAQRHLCRDVLPELLKIINAPLAPEARRERDILLVVQKQRELSKAERTTLCTLIDAVELTNARR